ncbi:hypothetical protein V5799_027891, partial [Amblyomma americanum]
PRRKEDHKYGTMIDRDGCRHKVLQTKGTLLTATCRAKCGKVTHPIRDGTLCLRSLRRSERLNKNGKRRCFLGTCHEGHCGSPYGREVNCNAPRGTVYYYDDYNNYNYDDDTYYYNEDYGYYYGDYTSNYHGYKDNIHAE